MLLGIPRRVFMQYPGAGCPVDVRCGMLVLQIKEFPEKLGEFKALPLYQTNPGVCPMRYPDKGR